MEFRNLKRQYQVLKDDMEKAILNVAESGAYINGNAVSEFEKEVAEYVGVKHCVSCANGTDALTMTMMAYGIGEGDAVIVPDFTFFSTGEIVSFAGATPIFTDIDTDIFNMDPDSLEKTIKMVKEEGKYNLKAVIAVDIFGVPADYRRIRKITDKYGLLLIEDGAQGFGGSLDGKKCCSFGDISTTSFFPAKPLGCYGDGGAVFTNDDEIAELLKSIRVHGKGENKYDNIRLGLNSRLDTIQAAVLRVKLKAFKEYELEAVNKAAETYTSLLKDVVDCPVFPEGFKSSLAQYTIKLKNKEERDGLQAFLKEKGIPSMIYYTKPMHKQKVFDNLHYSDEPFPNTIDMCNKVLSLPMDPYITEEEIKQVADVVKEFINK